MNQIILIGRLVRDPEIKYSNSGVAVTRFTLAVDRVTKNEEKSADFIDCVTFQKLAEVVANNLGKGRLVAVTGQLQVRSYEGNDGVKRKASAVIVREVKFLDFKKERAEAAAETDPFAPEEIPF